MLSCGKIGQGKFCSECGTKLIPISRLCCGLLVDGSTCNEPIPTTQEFCSSCVQVQRVEQLIKEECETQAIRRMTVRKKKASNSRRMTVRKKKASNITTEEKDATANASDQILSDAACTGSECVAEKDLEEIASDISDQEKSGRMFIASLSSSSYGSEDEVRELKSIARDGAVKLKEYIESINNKWKTIPVNIAVTGAAGSGKSTFINIIRGLKKGTEGYAEVDVTETTSRVKPYTHPRNPSLIFWDMPGVGTQSFRQDDSYLELIDFKKYDFFLIISHKRFRQEDGWLAKKITESSRSFCFIRTHVDADVSNDKKEDPTNHLIDSYETNQYDFNDLTNTLIKSNFLGEGKRKAVVLSLTLITNEVIEEKRKELEKRIGKIAMTNVLMFKRLDI